MSRNELHPVQAKPRRVEPFGRCKNWRNRSGTVRSIHSVVSYSTGRCCGSLQLNLSCSVKVLMAAPVSALHVGADGRFTVASTFGMLFTTAHIYKGNPVMSFRPVSQHLKSGHSSLSLSSTSTLVVLENGSRVSICSRPDLPSIPVQDRKHSMPNIALWSSLPPFLRGPC
jgi:hypothetical protein